MASAQRKRRGFLERIREQETKQPRQQDVELKEIASRINQPSTEKPPLPETKNDSTIDSANDSAVDSASDTANDRASDRADDSSVDSANDSASDSAIGQVIGRSIGQVIAPKNDSATDSASDSAQRKPGLKKLGKNAQKLLLFLVENFPSGKPFTVQSKDLCRSAKIEPPTFWRCLKAIEKQGFIKRKRVVDGAFQGMTITLNSKACKNIKNDSASDSAFDSTSDSAKDILTGQKSAGAASPALSDALSDNSVRKDSFNNKYLLTRISEAEMETLWPQIFASGLRPKHVKEIVKNLDSKGISADDIPRSFNHIEYALEKDLLKDGQGKKIEYFPAWCVKMLSRYGYFKAPEGYISPEAQAEHDRLAERERIARAEAQAKKAQAEALEEKRRLEEQKDQVEFEKWQETLTKEEMSQIANSMPGSRGELSEFTLKLYWKSCVKKKQATPSNPEAGENGS